MALLHLLYSGSRRRLLLRDNLTNKSGVQCAAIDSQAAQGGRDGCC